MNENLVQFALVLENRGEHALVKLYRPTACAGCHACQIGDGRNEMLEIKNPLQAEAGQNVKIEMAPRSMLQVATLVYGLPLLFLAAGYALGVNLAPYLGYTGNLEFFGITFGLVAVVLSFGFLRLIDNRVKQTARFQPVISAVLTDNMIPETLGCPAPGKA